MSQNEIVVGLAAIVVFGVGAQWVGRRLSIPSILLLLPAGLLAGPILGLVEPEELFGSTLFPGVSLLVALLLFGAALRLRTGELPPEARGPVVRLLAIGMPLTFLGGSLAVAVLFDVPVKFAFLVGAILVVSGPTVVGPLVAAVRPREPTSSILTWEGVFLDPIGATLGVVVLNLVLASERHGLHPVLQMMGRLGVGVGVGLGAAALFVLVMWRFFVTDEMEVAVALLFAVAAFAVAQIILSEAGLFATTTLGFAVANQSFVPVRRIEGFGETLEVLIIGTLFVTLGALTHLDHLENVAWRTTALVAVLVVLVRPISVAVSMFGSRLPRADRMFAAWLDPRGVVAAATAAEFSGSLTSGGLEQAFLLPVVFGVILGTGVVYGLTTPFVARRLGIVEPEPHGVGLVGAAPWVVDLAHRLRDHGVSVLLVVSEASGLADRDDIGVPTVSAVDDEDTLREWVLRASLAQVLVAARSRGEAELLTPQLIDVLGRRNVLPLPRRDDDVSLLVADSGSHRFGAGVTLERITALVAEGAVVCVVEEVPDSGIALAAVEPDGSVNLTPVHAPPSPEATVIAVVPGDAAPRSPADLASPDEPRG